MKEGDLILGTVKEVTNTIVFVDLPEDKKGTIISSEIAPGRIKYMRAYVVPNKKIVCKILKISGNNIDLSLRRVTSKEKKEVMQRFKQSEAIKLAFKKIFEEKEEEITKKLIKDFESIPNFVKKAKEDEKLIEKYIPKDKQEAIKKIVEKRQKKVELRQKIKIKCLKDNGIKEIKDIFNLENKNIEVTYISAGNFRLKLSAEDYKKGKKEMVEVIEKIKEKAKKSECEFNHEEEK